MGGCFSVSISCDQVSNQISEWLCIRGSYMHNLSKNVASLKKAMEALKSKRNDVERRVNREEFTRHRQRLSQVQVWLTNIQNIEKEVTDLLSTSELEIQRLCLCGFCSKNVKLSYLYGEKVILKLSEVKSLSSPGEFVEVTEPVLIDEVDELPIQPTIVGQEMMLEKVWNHLMDDKVEIVGLYGMGGVGKTTLLKQINNKFSEIGGVFDLVIWIDVSKNATVRKIQRSIAKKLGLEGKEWDEKDEKGRAVIIHKVLTNKKFVLLLDDIWEKVSLDVIGVPHPKIENGCKVVFTTRSLDVCGKMRVDDPIEVSCLDPDKAWDLFKERVGKNTLKSHPDIPELAKEVARKCKGLPLALNVIGETMACKRTVQEWQKAIYDLKISARDFSGMVDEILVILKYSYDNIKGEQVKSCLLYCSLFPGDELMEKERLIEMWIGEGLIDEKKGKEWGLSQGYEIIGTLVRACLLMNYKDEERSKVSMHDVVREMAIWIGSDEERCIVQAGFGLGKIPQVKNWNNVRRMSLMQNKIKKISESLDCPELITLLLGNNSLKKISGELFRSMPKLLVLDLSRNNSLSGLPEQISSLVSLRYLNLSYTNLKQLPVGLYKLKMLIHLDVDFTGIESLQGISNFSSLRTLKLRGSIVKLDISLMKELQLLQHLESISVTMSPSLVGELLNYPSVGRCIQQVDIYGKETLGVLVLPGMDNLRKVNISKCGMWEIKIEKAPWNKTLSKLCFSNLSFVNIKSCDGLKELTWMLFAPNLVNLSLSGLKKLEEIISEEKAASLLDKETFSNLLPFQKLEVLELNDLPKLKSIYGKALPFQRLRRLHIYKNCKKLRKLPLDSRSVLRVEEFSIKYVDKEWVKGIEWEDEATQQRFLPLTEKGIDYNEFV